MALGSKPDTLIFKTGNMRLFKKQKGEIPLETDFERLVLVSLWPATHRLGQGTSSLPISLYIAREKSPKV